MKSYKYGFANILPLEKIAQRYFTPEQLADGIPARIEFTPRLWIHAMDCMKIADSPVKVDGSEIIDGIEFTHIITPDGNNYYVPDTILTSYSRKNTPRAWKPVTCSCCGAQVLPGEATKGTNGKYVCNQCLEVKGYFTANNNTSHKETAKGYTVGFELECVPYSEEAQASLCDKRFGFIPTHDSSLPRNGVEFKSPIFKSLRGLRRMFRKFTAYADFSHSYCGQHINVGHTDYDASKAYIIRAYKDRLFRPLNDYMVDHPDDTRRVCGRYFTTYADRMENSPQLDSHSSFINLSHDNRIEFRISKMRTPDQYFILTNMWIEMMGLLIKFAENAHYESRDRACVSASKCGNKLVSVFIKYASGLSTVQNRLR